MLPLILALFILVPIAELFVIIQVGGAIGIVPTIALLVFTGFVGAALTRSQSRVAWERFNRALAEGRVPGREVFDGAMIIVGGALLLTPGFITDVVGIALLTPPTRGLVRKFLTYAVARRAGFAWQVATFGAARRRSRADRPPGRGYDYEGSAREVTDPAAELDEPGDRGERG